MGIFFKIYRFFFHQLKCYFMINISFKTLNRLLSSLFLFLQYFYAPFEVTVVYYSNKGILCLI